MKFFDSLFKNKNLNIRLTLTIIQLLFGYILIIFIFKKIFLINKLKIYF